MNDSSIVKWNEGMRPKETERESEREREREREEIVFGNNKLSTNNNKWKETFFHWHFPLNVQIKVYNRLCNWRGEINLDNHRILNQLYKNSM